MQKSIMNDSSHSNPQPRHWYVAIVNHNTERAVAARLDADDCECYVAAQTVMRVLPCGRRKQVERVVIPSLLFINCTETTRMRVVNTPYIYRFLTDRANQNNCYGKNVAIIPDEQMRRLQFMLGNSDEPVEFVDNEYRRGDRVRVTRGPMCGLEGLAESDSAGHAFIYVNLPVLGAARTKISLVDLERV